MTTEISSAQVDEFDVEEVKVEKDNVLLQAKVY